MYISCLHTCWPVILGLWEARERVLRFPVPDSEADGSDGSVVLSVVRERPHGVCLTSPSVSVASAVGSVLQTCTMICKLTSEGTITGYM